MTGCGVVHCCLSSQPYLSWHYRADNYSFSTEVHPSIELTGSRALTEDEYTSADLVQLFRPGGEFDSAQITRSPALFM